MSTDSTANRYYCYILYNDKNSLTYVGITNNMARRIRQHNTEIVGGAIYTTRMVRKHGVRWNFLCALTFNEDAIFTKNVAMSIEWHLKFAARTQKSFRSHIGRLQSIPVVLSKTKTGVLGLMPTVHVHERFIHVATQILQGYSVLPLPALTKTPDMISQPVQTGESSISDDTGTQTP